MKKTRLSQSTLIFFLCVVCCNCSDHSVSGFPTTTQIQVYTMQCSATDLYNAYVNSDYIFFTYAPDGSNYVVNASALGANISSITMIKKAGPFTVAATGGQSFNLQPLILYNDNVQTYLSKLKTADNINFPADTANYIFNFTITGITGPTSGRYPAIQVRVSKITTPNSLSSKYVNPNPCPPCHTRYSGN